MVLHTDASDPKDSDANQVNNRPGAGGTSTIGSSALPVRMGHKFDNWRRRLLKVVEVGDRETGSAGEGLD